MGRVVDVERTGALRGISVRAGRWSRPVIGRRGHAVKESERGIVEGKPAAATLSRDALFRRALLLCDVGSAGLALLISTMATPAGPTPLLALGAVPLLVLVNKLSGLYDRDELRLNRATLEEAPDLFQAATVYSLLVGLGTRVLEPGVGGQAEVLTLWPVLFLSMLASRACARRALNKTVRPERCLVLGHSTAAERIADSLRKTTAAGAEVVAHLPIESTVELNGSGTGNGGGHERSELVTEIARNRVDRVIVVSGSTDSDLLLDAVRVVKFLGVKVSVVPQLFDVVGSSASVDDIDGLLLLGLQSGSLTKSSRGLKRSFDLAAAGTSLVVLAPLLALSAALVALVTRRGPIERHARLTRDGEPFDMLSLRTVADHSQGERGETLGRLLRVGSLHALPRLVNVLRGEMSLVGPRPRSPFAEDPIGVGRNGAHVRSRLGGRPGVEAFPEPVEVPMRPGLTGLWRTDGGGNPPAEESAKLDYLYSSRWSAWYDIRIILRSLATAAQNAPAVEAIGRWIGPGTAAEPGHAARARRFPGGLPRVSALEPARVASGRTNGASAVPAKPPVRTVRLSVIVPATDSPPTLEPCLAALRGAADSEDEIIVVDRCERQGPAAARNVGAARARGDVLVFVDADVVVHRDALDRTRSAFMRDPELAATFGAYDDGLTSNGTVGTFRNLLHHHVHHGNAGEAGTFWSGLGAVRRDVFSRFSGFDERFLHASVEDIDLGMRIKGEGSRIVLNPNIQGTHLKNWTLTEMVRTDFLRRGVPWVGLLLRTRRVPGTTLNLSWSHRLSALSSLAVTGALVARRPSMGLAGVLGLLGLNRRFYGLLARRYGLGMSVAGMGLHVIHHLVSVAALPVGVAKHLTDQMKRGPSASKDPSVPLIELVDHSVAGNGHRNGVSARDRRQAVRAGG